MIAKRLIALSALSGLVAGCGSLPIPEEVPALAAPTVALEVTGNNELRVLTPAEESCVKAGLDINGCFEVGKNRVAFVRFTLQNSSGWQFQNLEICLGESQPGSNCNLTPWNRLEFIAATSRTSDFILPDPQGIIDVRLLGADLSTFFLATQNLYEQWWYYRIQVCPSGTPPDNDVNDPNCKWNVDPPMKNRGRRFR